MMMVDVKALESKDSEGLGFMSTYLTRRGWVICVRTINKDLPPVAKPRLPENGCLPGTA